MEINRVTIVALFFSAAGLGTLAGYEGWVGSAASPLPGDKPTYAFGSTTRPDGSPVQLGDKITPPVGLALMVRTVAMKEQTLKSCIKGKLFQYEYDAYISLAYNVGAGDVCDSSIPGKLAREEYEAACKTILDFKKVQGRDCAAPENKRFCGGVWTRRQSEYRRCMGGAW
ncbi:lysozyme [Azospira sp. I13]|uniref:glycoside hydrolase family protein n=1 Tax=Azospira sp. I13 TaxID=1765050 RepID=UPI000D4AF630|nr:glycoside hydrolase family protein [Azospira sp. I13]GBG03916.1 lysozyme [Azospira sp. I13]